MTIVEKEIADLLRYFTDNNFITIRNRCKLWERINNYQEYGRGEYSSYIEGVSATLSWLKSIKKEMQK